MSMKRFLYNYPIITIVVMLWALGLVTYTMISVLSLATEVNAALASIVAAVVGIPSAAFAFYQARMELKEKDIARQAGDRKDS